MLFSGFLFLNSLAYQFHRVWKQVFEMGTRFEWNALTCLSVLFCAIQVCYSSVIISLLVLKVTRFSIYSPSEKGFQNWGHALIKCNNFSKYVSDSKNPTVPLFCDSFLFFILSLLLEKRTSYLIAIKLKRQFFENEFGKE